MYAFAPRAALYLHWLRLTSFQLVPVIFFFKIFLLFRQVKSPCSQLLKSGYKSVAYSIQQSLRHRLHLAGSLQPTSTTVAATVAWAWVEEHACNSPVRQSSTDNAWRRCQSKRCSHSSGSRASGVPEWSLLYSYSRLAVDLPHSLLTTSYTQWPGKNEVSVFFIISLLA